MASATDSSQRGETLNLLRGPPGTSQYAGSEASIETATVSFASDSTIGDYFQNDPPQYNTSPIYAQVPREPGNTLPSNPSTNTPLPLLQISDGDTLIFINPPPSTISPEIASRRFGAPNTPLRVHSQALLSSGSQVFVQLLGPSMQQRHLNRLFKQKKITLINGKLPAGVHYVLDLTPEDEGEKAVEWQEKLWCPDVVLQWKSNLVDYFESPPSAQDQMAKNLEEFRQRMWGEQKPLVEGQDPSSQPLVPPPPPPKKDHLPEPYSFGRHVLALERLIHIIHGNDPLVQTTVDWYTLHCLSVAFGTTDATRDYVARWIFSNSLMIETHPAFIIKVAAEAGLATIASDAFAAAVMRASFDPEQTAQVPGAPEASVSLISRAHNELKDLLNMDWIDQYLPPTSDVDKEAFDPFRLSLRSYISRRMKLAGSLDQIDLKEGYLEEQAVQRNTWINLSTTNLASDNTSSAPSIIDAPTRFDLEKAVLHWGQWEASGEGARNEVDDLWKDVKLGAPHYPIPSVTQQTSIQDSATQLEVITYEDDATSEVISNSGTELPNYHDDDVKSVSSTHTINSAMRALKTENNPIFQDSSATLVNPPSQAGPSNPSPVPLAPVQVQEDVFAGQIAPIIKVEYDDDKDHVYRPSFLHPSSSNEATNANIISDPGPSSLFPNSDPGAPLWLKAQLNTLSNRNSPAYFWAVMHHPSHDYTKPAEPRIRCADCPDMLYFPGPGETLDNFRVHLRNIKHMNRIESRRHAENRYGSDEFSNEYKQDSYNKHDWYGQKPEIEIPFTLLTIIRLCETYIKSKCAEMTTRNIVFEPILLEEQLACLEESERAFMPVWSGGETVGSTKGIPNRGISDHSANDDMSVNVSTVGVGSVATASTFSTTSSYVDIDTPSASSSGSVISLSESGDDDDAVMSPVEGDDWVMSDSDDEDYEVDDDIYFS
ncbi:hypothetical protein TWF481_001520 [Arthrobotrys musiformis]|uniref:BED-type domain-containing protein n=1 Tax=Arthrobotrys musiformis TaxID=47236 RepID=A0AAV9WSF5_9PEZI